MSANIRTARDDHQRCLNPRFQVKDWGFPGDVRRCPHGWILLAFVVPGMIPPYWRELHPVFNPIRWRRARRALDGGS